MSDSENKDRVEPSFNSEDLPPMNEEEAIKKQKKQFMIFGIAGIVMLVVAFFAGRTVSDWVSDDTAPISSPISVEVVTDEA